MSIKSCTAYFLGVSHCLGLVPGCRGESMQLACGGANLQAPGGEAELDKGPVGPLVLPWPCVGHRCVSQRSQFIHLLPEGFLDMKPTLGTGHWCWCPSPYLRM